MDALATAVATAPAVDGLGAIWEGAEDCTNHAIAHAYEGLDAAERNELIDLAVALHSATKG